MNRIFLIIVTMFTISAFAQDFLVTEKNDTIFCQITEMDGKRITYIEKGKKKSTSQNIHNFIDANITDISLIENPLGLKIEKPQPGYAHVYFYRPYTYTGSALGCRILHNDENFINIKTNSYYLHKIEAGQLHFYRQRHETGEGIKIDAKDGEIYFIQSGFFVTQSFHAFGQMSNNTGIFLDNPKIARYAILTMKKESPTY